MDPEPGDGRLDETQPFEVLSPGATISQYRIIEKIGAGGMGVVYKAEDTKLKRNVALKFLPPHLTKDPAAKERFVREARAASSLDHPNICTIYEINQTQDGRMFISMACYDGETLRSRIERQPVDLEGALEVAIQIGEGLAKAHDEKIVHRDIKPGNIFVTDDGRAKILDFGLAKLSGQSKLTEVGTTAGTVAYMSPEQARGEKVDHRADIWSLGVVLYEMLTAKQPFAGEHPQVIIHAILNEEPEPMSNFRSEVQALLRPIVDKALSKNKNDRYQEMRDLVADLKKAKDEIQSHGPSNRASREARKPSIAVLPFADLSADKDQEYFCDGMTEEIINAVTHVDGLRVVARTSSFAYKGKHADIREIGRRLNVETVLEGSVRKARNRLRVTAQLVNVRDGYHLWSEKYDRDLEDIFAIQDEISLAIVDKLKVELLGGEEARITRRHGRSVEAFELYLRGRYFWNKRTEESLKKAIDLFEQAIAVDPDYALAYAGLGETYVILPQYTSFPPEEAYPRARQAASRALQIDSEIAEAHATLAMVHAFFERDWLGAEEEYTLCIRLKPGYATVHHWYAVNLMFTGRSDEAIKEIEQAYELDPLSLIIRRNLGLVYLGAGELDRAEVALKKVIAMDPSFSLAHAALGDLYLKKRLCQEAIEEYQKEYIASPLWGSYVEALIAAARATIGEVDEARQVLKRLMASPEHGPISRYGIIRLCFAVGDEDQGFEWMNRAYEERDIYLYQLRYDSYLDGVRSDSRYKALMKGTESSG